MNLDQLAQKLWDTIPLNVREKPSPLFRAELEKVINAYEKLCKLYFDIAAEVIGEDEVRKRRDAMLPESNPPSAAIVYANPRCPTSPQSATPEK